MNDLIITFPIIQRPGLTDEMIISQLQLQILQLINLGALKGNIDDILKDFEIQKDSNMIAVTVPEEAIGTATDKFLTVGAGMNRKVEIPKEFLVTEIKEEPEVFDRSFSMIQIVDRMRNAMRQPRVRFRYLIMDYKKYYKVAKKSLEKNPEKAQKLKNMFVTDVMGMFTEVLPLIEEGKQLQALVGTSQITPKLTKSARDLSLAYRRALRQEKGAGQINKAYWTKLKNAYQEFMTVLMDNVFPGLTEIEVGGNEQKEESRKYSYYEDGRAKLFSEFSDEVEKAKAEEDRANEEIIEHHEEESAAEYSKTEDGRIKLFEESSKSSDKKFRVMFRNPGEPSRRKVILANSKKGAADKVREQYPHAKIESVSEGSFSNHEEVRNHSDNLKNFSKRAQKVFGKKIQTRTYPGGPVDSGWYIVGGIIGINSPGGARVEIDHCDGGTAEEAKEEFKSRYGNEMYPIKHIKTIKGGPGMMEAEMKLKKELEDILKEL